MIHESFSPDYEVALKSDVIVRKNLRLRPARMPVNMDNRSRVMRFLDKFDTILSDCDGVLWLNNEAVPGAPSAINKLRALGKKIIFATNNSTKTREEFQDKLTKLGYHCNLDELFPTSYASAFNLNSIGFNKKVYVFGCSGNFYFLSKILSKHYHHYDSIILHSFSMGSYQMGELLVLLEQDQHRDIYSKLRPRIKGVIFDSPVDIDWIDIGIGNTITTNPLLQWIIMSLVKGHLSLSHNIAAKHYIIASAIVHKNAHKYPILMFFSKDDVATNWEHMCGVIERWREDGISVWFKCRDRSLHVSHYYKHPREYVEKVD